MLFFRTLTVEHGVARPSPSTTKLKQHKNSIGDVVYSPLFHRFSEYCPVLSLFGYVEVEDDSNYANNEFTACLHVHGVYPYFYVCATTPHHKNNINDMSPTEFGAQLEEYALQSIRDDQKFKNSKQKNNISQVIHNVEVVMKRSLYGYRPEKELFFKISYIHPNHLRVLLRLLRETSRIGGTRWTVLESHIEYTSQFLNLYSIKGITPFVVLDRSAAHCSPHPSVTARYPFPPALVDFVNRHPPKEKEQVGSFLVLPQREDSFVRLTSCQMEVDIDESTLLFFNHGGPNNSANKAGEHLLFMQNVVKQYFKENHVDDSLRIENTITEEEKRLQNNSSHSRWGTVELVQQDSLLSMMRETLNKNLSFIQNNNNETGAVSATPVPPQTYELLDQLNNNATRGGFDISTSEDSFALSHPNSELLRNSGAADLGEGVSPVTHGPCKKGDGVAFVECITQHNNNDNEKEKVFPPSLLCAGIITDITVDASDHKNSTVHLKWFLPSSETHFSAERKKTRRNPPHSQQECTAAVTVGTKQHTTTLFGGEVFFFNNHNNNVGNPISIFDPETVSLPTDHLNGNCYSLTVQCVPLLIYSDYGTYKTVMQKFQTNTNHNNMINAVCLFCRYEYLSNHTYTPLLKKLSAEDISLFQANNYNRLNENGNNRDLQGVFNDDELLRLSSLMSLNSHTNYENVSQMDSLFLTAPESVENDTDTNNEDASGDLLLFSSSSSSGGEQSDAVGEVRQNRKMDSSLFRELRALLTIEYPNKRQLPQKESQPIRTEIFSQLSSQSPMPNNNNIRPDTVASSTSQDHCSSVVDQLTRTYQADGSDNVQHHNVRWPDSSIVYPRDKDTPDGDSLRLDLPLYRKTCLTQESTKKMPETKKKEANPSPDQKTDTPMTYSEEPNTPHPRHQTPHGCKEKSASMSASQRKYLQESPLKVLSVEVLVRHRRSGHHTALVEEELLAVALGQTWTTQEEVAVRLFCVDKKRNHKTEVPSASLSENVRMVYFPTEQQLLLTVVEEIRRYDPDVLLSWEGYKYGLGLVAQRYNQLTNPTTQRKDTPLAHKWGHYQFARAISRYAPTEVKPQTEKEENETPHAKKEEEEEFLVPSEEEEPPPSDDDEPPSHPVDPFYQHTAAYTERFGADVLRTPGRLTISLSRCLRKEISMPSYSITMVYEKVCGGRLPYFSDAALTCLYDGYDHYPPAGQPLPPRAEAHRRTALRYLYQRTVASHTIARQVKYYSQQVQFSSLFGMLVQDVHRRGHQFRVETTFHRLTAPLDYILYSPSIEEVHRQPRIQTEPLILAPKAGYYQEDPVVVLDFRSLYPSVTIAYNLCYSTCLGVLREGGSLEGRLGVDLRYKTDLPALQREDVLFSPSGAMFVPASCREGLLPRLLRLVLDTRFEVQAALEHVAGPAGDTEAQVQLKARQFALKMLANTAYGYTAASFTGRMPCVDLAEAIVSLGRLTLERAIRQIEDTPAWGAEVLYGDTDSIFVLLKGRSRAEAFVMGETIAAAITAANPSPVRLQFEKVLQPTLLLVKKRYAGYMWTSPQQTTPTFLAKGIETVRRDQCAATAKVARRLLVSLFDGADPRTLHGLYTKEVSKFQRGVCDPYECIFRRAVKLQRYAGKDVSHLPLGAHLALQEMQKDMARTPYWGERLPYVVARSLHSDRLKDRVVHPERLLEVSCEGEKGWSIDAEYYITKHLNAAVDRLLLGVHLSASRWFREMPRRYHNSALLRVSDFRRVERRRIKSREEKGLPGSTISERTITPLSREEPSTVAHKRSRPSTDELDVISIDSSVEEIQRDSTIVCSDNSEVGSPPVRARTLDGYYQHLQCVVCGAGMMNPREQNRRITSYMHGGDAHRPATGEAAPLHTLPPTCEACWSDPQRLLLHVMAGYHLLGRRLAALRRVCQSCIGGTMDIEDCAVAAVSPHIVQAKVRETDLTCTSTDCELNFEKTRVTELYIQYELWGWFLRQYFW